MPEIRQALDELNRRLIFAGTIGETLAAAAVDEPPPWVHVYQIQVDGIREASEALEVLLRRRVLGQLHAPGQARGDGGYAPHGDAALADPGTPSRTSPCPLARSGSRLDKQGSGGALPGGGEDPLPSCSVID